MEDYRVENHFSVSDIKSRILKDSKGISNYINVSIEEMDWLVEQAEKVEQQQEEIGNLQKEILNEQFNYRLVRDMLSEKNETIEKQKQEIKRLKSEHMKLQARIDFLMTVPCKCEVENL